MRVNKEDSGDCGNALPRTESVAAYFRRSTPCHPDLAIAAADKLRGESPGEENAGDDLMWSMRAPEYHNVRSPRGRRIRVSGRIEG